MEESNNKETYWSQYAGEFEEKQSQVVGREILMLMQEELLKESDLGEVLELGCGTGLFTVALQKFRGMLWQLISRMKWLKAQNRNEAICRM